MEMSYLSLIVHEEGFTVHDLLVLSAVLIISCIVVFIIERSFDLELFLCAPEVPGSKPMLTVLYQHRQIEIRNYNY